MPTFYHPLANSDYSHRSRSSVSFPAGTNEATFTLTIRDDGLIESDEEFYIELEIKSSAANRGVTKHSDNAKVIIFDDDSESIAVYNTMRTFLTCIHNCVSQHSHAFIHCVVVR